MVSTRSRPRSGACTRSTSLELPTRCSGRTSIGCSELSFKLCSVASTACYGAIIYFIRNQMLWRKKNIEICVCMNEVDRVLCLLSDLKIIPSRINYRLQWFSEVVFHKWITWFSYNLVFFFVFFAWCLRKVKIIQDICGIWWLWPCTTHCDSATGNEFFNVKVLLWLFVLVIYISWWDFYLSPVRMFNMMASWTTGLLVDFVRSSECFVYGKVFMIHKLFSRRNTHNRQCEITSNYLCS